LTTSIARTTPAQKPRGLNKIIFLAAVISGSLSPTGPPPAG
jgi:hypothetical protein